MQPMLARAAAELPDDERGTLSWEPAPRIHQLNPAAR
jgi:hypothetical protein